MHVYRNGDRCPCCGTVIQDKSREWLREFSALCQALGFGIGEDDEPEEARDTEGVGHYSAGPRERARREPGRTAEG